MKPKHKKTAKAEKETALSGDVLYNAIMMKLEPDLLTFNLPYLDEKYHDESEEDRAARKERYAAAFTLFDLQLQNVTDALGTLAHESAQKSREELRKKEHAEHTKEMDRIAEILEDDSPSSRAA